MWGRGVCILFRRRREVAKHIEVGLRSLVIKLLFLLWIFMFSPITTWVYRNVTSAAPQQASAAWASAGRGLFLSNLDFEGVSGLASLLNTVIELWFLTVAGNIAKGCIVVRDCGFDNYVLLHCRAIYFAWVKELANTNFMFSYFPHWVIAEWVIPPKCSKFDFIQMQTG